MSRHHRLGRLEQQRAAQERSLALGRGRSVYPLMTPEEMAELRAMTDDELDEAIAASETERSGRLVTADEVRAWPAGTLTAQVRALECEIAEEDEGI